MQTKNYTTDLLPLIKAICGTEFASIELPRIQAMVNRRAKRAYRATDWWTRFLVVGEERVISANVIPFTEVGLDPIDTFLRIHKSQPWQSTSVQEFDYSVTADGATIISGSLNPTSVWVTYKKQLDVTYGDGSGTTTASIPDEWFEYIAHGVYSDDLRSGGQQEKAAYADKEAEEILQDELMKLERQLTLQTVGNRIRTTGNMQNRNT